jgi:hypothetical protein
MRRVRNYDAELKALDAKARVLKAKNRAAWARVVRLSGTGKCHKALFGSIQR